MTDILIIVLVIVTFAGVTTIAEFLGKEVS